VADNENNSPAYADNEFGSPAQVDVEAEDSTAAIKAGVPLEDEDKDYIEEAYEATQREVEQDIHGEQVTIPAKFNSVDELVQSYENLENKLSEYGPQANENQALKERLARLEGHALAQQQTPAVQSPPRPRQDPRFQSRKAFAEQRQRVYEEQGFESAVAKDIAQKDAVTLGMFVDAEISNRTQRYDAAMAATDRDRNLQSNAYQMREQKDAQGRSVRPDWDHVVSTKEFENAARELGDRFYTPQGLELAYLRTSSAVRGQASSASAQAEASASKRRASVGPAATPASKNPSRANSDDAEIEAIYNNARESRRSRNVFDGGGFD
jgi:hypothetical protein